MSKMIRVLTSSVMVIGLFLAAGALPAQTHAARQTCAPGDLFNVNTGRPCSGNVSKGSGVCGPGAKFDTQTGLRCNASVPPPQYTHEYMAHDYNNDGSVDATDANYLLAVAVGSASCPSGKACDINNDGRVTASDALVLVKSVFDYTRDGSVTSADTSELLRVATGVISCPTGTLCDINRDGKVNTSDVLALQRMISGTVLGASCHTFTRNLALHMSGDDVAALQDALTQDGEAVENTGYFGPITSAAAKAFQEKYASEVLTPNNLTHGTGYVGVSTRNKLNQLYGCSV